MTIKVDTTETGTTFVAVYHDTDHTFSASYEHYKHKLWNLGPRFGVNTNWLLGCGFRLFGDAAGSVLFTQTTLATNGTLTGSGATSSIVADMKINTQNSIRPNIETSLGLGWCTYFDNQNWHVDLALGYDFNYWHDFLVTLVDDGALYIQGAKFSARLDF